MRFAVAFLLIAACCAVFSREGPGQSNGTDTAAPDKNNPAQGEAKKVWDNDAIQKLRGGVSVVGNSSAGRAAGNRAGNPRTLVASKALPVRRVPGLQFKAITLEGDELTGDSLLGKTVLVQFWTTWCPHCRKDQSPLDSIARDFEDKGLVVLAVNVDEPKNTVMKYLRQSPRACQVALAKDTDLATLFPPSRFPTYVLIDRNGRFAGKKQGEAGEQGLRNLLGRAGINSE